MATYLNIVPCKGFVWKQSFINCITKRCNLGYTQSALSGCTKGEPFGPTRYIAPSPTIHIIFSEAFRSIVPYFSLALFKFIIGKQLTKKYTSKKCTLGCTEGALKQSPLELDDMVYRKQKLAGLSQKSFTFMLHVLFYVFIKDVLQNSVRTTAPINNAP